VFELAEAEHLEEARHSIQWSICVSDERNSGPCVGDMAQALRRTLIPVWEQAGIYPQ